MHRTSLPALTPMFRLALALITLAAGCSKTDERNVQIRVFVTALNPLSHGAVDAVRKVAAAMPDRVKIEINYHVDAERVEFVKKHQSWKVTPPTGSAAKADVDYVNQQWEELATARAHVCGVKHNGLGDATLQYLSCLYSGGEARVMPWDECAPQAKLAVEPLGACIDGDEAAELLIESAKKSEKVRGTPSIIIGGKKYLGPRTPDRLLEAACKAISKDKPSACTTVKPPTPLKGIWLTDKRCDGCEAMSAYQTALSQYFFPGLTLRSVDYSTDEGKAMYARLAASKMQPVLPALFIEKAVEKEVAFDQVKMDTEDLGEFVRFRVAKAAFQPNAEICDNGIDDTNDGKVDCDDSFCTPTLMCRPLKEMSLDIYTVGLAANLGDTAKTLAAVHKQFGGDLTIGYRVIVEENPNAPRGLDSSGGEPEVLEDIRQLCIQAHHPIGALLEYLACRAKDVKADWRACAASPINADAVNGCATGEEGTKLMTENVAMLKSFTTAWNVIPTLVINNRYRVFELQPEQIIAGICRRNSKHPRCAAK